MTKIFYKLWQLNVVGSNLKCRGKLHFVYVLYKCCVNALHYINNSDLGGLLNKQVSAKFKSNNVRDKARKQESVICKLD